MSMAALLDHPPFRMTADMDPFAAARDIVAAFDTLAATPAPLAQAFTLAM